MIHAITVNIVLCRARDLREFLDHCVTNLYYTVNAPADPCQGVVFFSSSLYMLCTCCLFLITVELREI